jgi:hypothetical protein
VYPSLRPVGGENLLLQSNQFDTTWTTSNTTVTGGQTGIGGSTDAWLLTKSAVAGAYIAQTISTSGVNTASVYVKEGTLDVITLWCNQIGGGNPFGTFNLTTQTLIDSGTIVDSNITSVGSGWYRVSITFSVNISLLRIYVNNFSDTTEGSIYIQNAQLEQGYRATPYTETTTSPATNADFSFTRGSAATRVTKDGLIKNVQILSDDLVQNGNFEEIGPEEVTNGDFATDLSGWQTSGVNATNTITWEYNGARFFCTNQNIGLSQQNVLTIGKAYKLTCDVNVTTGSIGLDGAILVGGSTVNLVNGFNEIYFVANSTTFKIKRTSTVSDCLLDNVSVKEVGQNWNFVGDTKVVNNGAKFDNTSVYSEISQDNVTTSGSRIRLTITVEDYVGGKIIFPQFGINSGNGDPNFNVEANGTYVFEGILYNSAFTIKRGLNGTNLVVSNVSIIEITDDTDLPRIDYTNGTGSLLLEPQSTNLALNSNDLTKSTWSKFNSTSESSNIINPEGTSGASEYVCDNYTGSNQYFRISQNTTYSSDVNYSYSVFVKYKTFQFCKLTYVNFNSIEHFTAVFDIINGIVTATDSDGTPQNTSANIQDFGNGWFRISISAAITSSAGNAMNFEFNKCPSGTPTFTSFGRTNQTTTTSDRIYIWGAQLEQGSYATSYIPTSGSTVTRNADVCNNAGSSDLINSTEGVLYAEISFPQDGRIALNDGTTGNNVRFTYQASNNTIFGILYNGSNQAVLTYQLPTENVFYKIAFKYKASDFSLYVNGVEVDSLTSSGTTFASDTLSQLDFDAGNGLVPFYGNVRSVAVFKEALTDEELAKITSTTQQEVFYEMRDKMLQIDADYYEFGDYTTRLKKLF